MKLDAAQEAAVLVPADNASAATSTGIAGRTRPPASFESGEEQLGQPANASFTRFFATAEPVLQRVFFARFGAERGSEATAEALAYAWENWDTLSVMANPIAYLYTVGRSRTRWHQRLAPNSSIADRGSLDKSQDPDLIRALARLSPRQRECVVLVEALGFTHREGSELLGILSTVSGF